MSIESQLADAVTGKLIPLLEATIERKLTEHRQIDGQEKRYGFLRLPQVLQLIPVSKATWWQLVKEGKAPAGIRLSANVTVWREADIDRYIREAGRDDCK
ncbi:helix-turn-helix transcriptional regulator [Aminirod propionatiphilus]|uniref:AlpA family phage regulatory protein n=1 Tax=Aminirod propionatiphilus TaxID=3415223 RepID=A0ACD1DTM1_9BACT|nr:AlpA family phage regulatory protein [Synergistaceae bacterium]QVL35500.1 AlpA family phage regulatory protein [Synergistota bacterium]